MPATIGMRMPKRITIFADSQIENAEAERREHDGPSAINPAPDSEAYAAVAAAVAALTELGHEVEELQAQPFDDGELAKDFLLIWFTHLAWQVDDIKRRTGCGDDCFEQDTLVVAAMGRGTSGTEYCGALERRHDHVRRPQGPAAAARTRPAVPRAVHSRP